MNRTEALERLIGYGLTADAAEKLIGKAETENCEPTGRVREYPHDDEEYKASATLDGRTGVDVFYYPSIEDIERMSEATGGDLSDVNWIVDHYATW